MYSVRYILYVMVFQLISCAFHKLSIKPAADRLQIGTLHIGHYHSEGKTKEKAHKHLTVASKYPFKMSELRHFEHIISLIQQVINIGTILCWFLSI